MNAQDARALFLNLQLSTTDFTTELPGLAELTGLLAIRELSAKDAVQSEKLSLGRDGKTDDAEMLGAMIVRSLVLRETKERIFQDNDMDAVASLGLSVLTPIATQIKEVSGIDQVAVESAKKNLTPTTSSDSATSSPENSEQALTQS